MPEHSTDPKLLREALWSVYFHAIVRPDIDSGELPSDLPRPELDLHGAVDYLRREEVPDELALPAVLRLAQARFLSPPIVFNVTGEPLDLDGGLSESIASLAARVGFDDEGIDLLRGGDPDDVNLAVDRLHDTPSEFGECVWYPRARGSGQTDDNGAITWITVAEFRQPSIPPREAFDPRSWARCSVQHFTTTERVANSGRESELIPRSRYYKLLNDPTPIGESWQGFLYEVVSVPGAVYKNILKIDFRVTSDEVRVGFSLAEPIEGNLAQDEGHLHVTLLDRAAGRYQIEAKKVLRHGGLGLHSPSNPLALNAFLLTADLLGKMGCCKDTAERPDEEGNS